MYRRASDHPGADYTGERNGIERKLRIFGQFVKDVGFPGLIALICLGLFTGYIPSVVLESAKMMKAHADQDETRTRIIRTMCIHQAITQRLDPKDCQ